MIHEESYGQQMECDFCGYVAPISDIPDACLHYGGTAGWLCPACVTTNTVTNTAGHISTDEGYHREIEVDYWS